MATDVKLPELGEGVTEGELVKWLVKPGDTVKPDQPIAEVMTDKATVEVPTPVGGVVKDLKFKVGEVIAVEKVLLTLDGAGASTAAPAAHAPKAAPAAAQPPAAAANTAPKSVAAAQPPAGASAQMNPGVYPPVAESRVLATPSTRRTARELNVDINALSGSGLAGRVTREDVLSAKGNGGGAAQGGMETYKSPSLEKPAYRGPAGAPEERVPLIGIRRKIAENLQMAKRIIPHFTLMDEAVVTDLVNLRESLKEVAEKHGTKITIEPEELDKLNSVNDNAIKSTLIKAKELAGLNGIHFRTDSTNGKIMAKRSTREAKLNAELH